MIDRKVIKEARSTVEEVFSIALNAKRCKQWKPTIVDFLANRTTPGYFSVEEVVGCLNVVSDMTHWLPKFSCRCGASRLVLVFHSGKLKDYVIKIPYGDRNDCSMECIQYGRVPVGLRDFFAEVQYGGSFKCKCQGLDCNIPFYIMRKVTQNREKFSHKFSLSLNQWDDFCSTAPQWMDRVFFENSHSLMECIRNILGDEKFIELASFLYFNGINDLHWGNVGWNNETPCFLDYAGDEEDEEDDLSSEYYDYDYDYDCE